MRESETQERKLKVSYDPTINLGHILTFIGFLSTIALGWITLDKRVITLEDTIKTQMLRDSTQDREQNNNTNHVTHSLDDLQRSVERLSDKVDLIKK